MKLCVAELDFPRIFCLSQILRKWTKNGSKTGLFKSSKKLAWICFIMKIYIICCIPPQLPYLWKFLFLRYRPKCFQPDFLHVDTNSQKLKVNWKKQPIYSLDSKTDCVWRMNSCNSWFFCMLVQIHAN